MEKKLKIVYVPRRSRIRPYKIAKALKYTEKVEQVLVCEESFYSNDLHNGLFDRVHFFTKKHFLFKLPKAEKIYRRINERFGFGFKKMIKQIQSENPDIVFCFAEPYNHIEYIIRNTDYKVIMCDGADFTGISEGIENLSSRTRKTEKFCFENVDGIVHKGPRYEIEFYVKHEFRITAPDLTYLDYVDLDFSIRKSTLKSNNDEFHLVYTGNISSDSEEKYVYYIPLAKSLAEQKIHFHIYPNPFQYHMAKDYKQLDKDSDYFHFHEPVQYKDLSKVLSNYDFGLWWHDPTGGKRINLDKSKVAIGNKLMTYIESSLPVIVGKHNGHGRIIIEENAVGFAVEKEDLENIHNSLKKQYKLCLPNIEKFQKDFSLRSKGPILLEFIYSIARK